MILSKNSLPFRYTEESRPSGLTGLAGLGAFLDLFAISGLWESLEKRLEQTGDQGFTDAQVVNSLLLLNLAGGDCVRDIAWLEADEGLKRLVRRAEKRRTGRGLRCPEKRFRKGRGGTFPSDSTIFRYLESFGDPAWEPPEHGSATIPEPTAGIAGLKLVNRDLLRFAQERAPRRVATLDLDATLIETSKREALWCYKGFQAYQPLQVWWAEQHLMVHTEFRDGNVSASKENLRVFRDALEQLPPGVETVRLRSDAAGYQHELMEFCEKEASNFGRIEFAISCPMSTAFRRAVCEVEPEAWQTLDRDQEWAEVCFVPNELCQSKSAPQYRYLAIREPLRQAALPGLEGEDAEDEMTTRDGRRYKLTGLVTNRTIDGPDLIRWYRERCGDSERAHAVLKDDLAAGRLPSARFGANAAWWWIAVLAMNLQELFKRLALPEEWHESRLKALRFHLIGLAGRVVTSAGRLLVRLSRGHPAVLLLEQARVRLARGAPSAA